MATKKKKSKLLPAKQYPIRNEDFTRFCIKGEKISDITDVNKLKGALKYFHELEFGVNPKQIDKVKAGLWIRLNQLLPDQMLRFTDVGLPNQRREFKN